MIIDFYTKNFSLLHTMEIDLPFVPRVGEEFEIYDHGFKVKQGEILLVHEVTYLVKDQTVVPYVKCHASAGAINRRIILEENGWI